MCCNGFGYIVERMFEGLVESIEAFDDDELAAELRRLDEITRRTEAAIAAVASLAERRKTYRRDGHQSVENWMAATAGWSRGECRRRRRLGRLTHEIPSCGEALWDGRIGTALADDLAAVKAHPRVGHEFTVDIAERVIERAQGIRYVDIAQVVKNWVSLMKFFTRKYLAPTMKFAVSAISSSEAIEGPSIWKTAKVIWPDFAASRKPISGKSRS